MNRNSLLLTIASGLAISAGHAAAMIELPDLVIAPASVVLGQDSPPVLPNNTPTTSTGTTTTDQATIETKQARVEYATSGSRAWSFGLGAGHDFDDATDVQAFAAHSWFLDDRIEVAAEAGGWYFSQPGEDEAGINASIIFRWHFYQSDDKKWTIYGDVGVGALLATGDVPAGGTNVDFMPRAGVGLTREINDSGLRLMAGLRWHHISNGRINGDDENPARDAPFIYFGIVIPY